MTTRGAWWIALMLCAAVLLGPLTQSVGAADSAKPASTAKHSTGEKAGVKLAETIATITGVAISPLLGVGSVGAWQWFHAAPGKRAQLPWFAQPWFWLPALFLVSLVFAKDALGTAMPASLKKPFDVVEAIENKISALIVAGLFVPIIASVSGAFDSSAATSLSAAGFAAMDFSSLLSIITVPAAIAVFAIVWLVAHTINVLILISPFGAVDAALKSFRLAVLTSLPVTSWIDPWFGALWAITIIVICYFLAGWSFRILIFGHVFIWDFLTVRHRRFKVSPMENWMFLARKTDKVPVRTYGRLSLNPEGRLVLKYRPWLFLAERALVLPSGNYAIGCGLLYPELMRVEGETMQTMFRLPPRYRNHEEELTQLYRLGPIQDVGFKAMWRWVKEIFGFKGENMPAAPVPQVAVRTT